MATETNKQLLLASRPEGMPKPENFRVAEAPIPAPEEGEVLLRILYLSLDPYLRGRMSAAKSYAQSVEIGHVIADRNRDSPSFVEDIWVPGREPSATRQIGRAHV